MSTGTSIRRTFAWRTANCARLGAIRTPRVRTTSRWKRFINVRNRACARARWNSTSSAGCIARIARLTVKEVLLKLKEAGVDSLPGGGAEIFHPRVRKIICDHKVSGQMWLNIARQAHEIGLRSNATMLYGHVETEEERVDHLVKLRELQDETHGFVAFIPLAFHPDNTALSHIPKPTGYADLRNIA